MSSACWKAVRNAFDDCNPSERPCRVYDVYVSLHRQAAAGQHVREERMG